MSFFTYFKLNEVLTSLPPKVHSFMSACFIKVHKVLDYMEITYDYHTTRNKLMPFTFGVWGNLKPILLFTYFCEDWLSRTLVIGH